MKRLQNWVFVLGFALASHAHGAEAGAPARRIGTATDAGGQSVAGATVECYQDSSTVAAYTAQDFALKERGTTDSKGAFSVPAGRGVMTVVLKKEGLAPGWRTFACVLPESRDPVILAAPTILAGMIVDEKGHPVADAEVWVSIAMPAPQGGSFSQSRIILGRPARDCFSVHTSTEGRFRIANFPADARADLAVRKSGMARRHGGDFSGSFRWGLNYRTLFTEPPPYTSGLQETLRSAYALNDIMPYKSGQQDIKLTLEPAGNIEGKVTVEGTGQPLAGVKLLLLSAGRGLSGIEMPEPVLSGADGSFRIADSGRGMQAIAALFSGDPVADWVATNASVTVVAGETTKDVQVRAQKGDVAPISVLWRKNRQPLANVSLSANRQGHLFSAITVTGADGVARFRLLPGHWHISASKEGWNDGRTEVTVVTGQQSQAEVQMDPYLVVRGIVRDPAGAPVAGAIVSLSPPIGDDCVVTTDASGRYEESWQVFVGGNQTAFSLMARSVERNLAVLHPIDDSTTNLDLKLEPAVTLLAKVEDSSGQPITNATGWLAGMDGDRPSELDKAFKSDARGRMELTAVPPQDSYQITVSASGHGYRSQQMPAPNRQTRRLEFPTFVLALANQKLAGKVVKRDGSPVAGVAVNCNGPNQPGGSTQTDAEGRFSFEGICEGPIQVSLAQGNGDGVHTVGGDTNVILRLRGGRRPGLNITGTVRDAAGAPSEGASVTVSPNPYRNPEVKTDLSGQYEIAWRVFNFDSRPCCLVARSLDGKLAGMREFEDSATTVDLTLQPSVTLAAKVQDARGKPVTNAFARVSVMNGKGGANWLQTAFHPDARGCFEITAMPPAMGYNLMVSAAGYGDGHQQIRFPASPTNRLKFRTVVLPLTSQELTGKVVDMDDRPAAEVRVRIWGAYRDREHGFEVKTGSDGRYVMNWRKQDWGATRWTPFIVARDPEHNLAVSPDVDETITSLDLKLQAGLTLSVKVQDANGKPIPTATGTLYFWSGLASFEFNPIPARADAQGGIQLDALPQERHYTLHIAAEGYGTAELQAQPGETQTTRFDFPTTVLPVAGSKLAGQVLGPDGKPFAKGTVFMGTVLQGGGQPSQSTSIGAQGRFAFDTVCAGTIPLFVNGYSADGKNVYGNAQAQAGDTNFVFRLRGNN